LSGTAALCGPLLDTFADYASALRAPVEPYFVSRNSEIACRISIETFVPGVDFFATTASRFRSAESSQMFSRLSIVYNIHLLSPRVKLKVALGKGFSDW
jgi:hypothetical protein